jgi:Domain of unknown function (DUF5063)
MDALITPRREALDPRVGDVVVIARRYCDLIEASGADYPHWLREVAGVLPRLQAAVTSLDCSAPQAEYDHPVDLDARFELYSHLRELLADRDGYFLEFDCAHDGADAMTGSLADDLTDIYCELLHGLRAFSSDPTRALQAWSLGYEYHWGQHLVDAQRHLAALAASDRLG